MLNKKTGLIALLASFAAGEIMAGTITNYVAGGGDVLICFRKGANNMVVDAGALSTFTSLSANQRYTIANYTGAQLTEFGGANGVNWSAFTWLNDDTLYITRPRPSTALNSQTTPWTPQSSASQHLTDGRMTTIPVGSTDEFNAGYDPLSSPTAVIGESSSVGNPNYLNGVSYTDAIFGHGSTANFYTTFQGVPENTTANNFTTAGKVLRSDFYQLTPGAASAAWLGYFELNTNGVMTYVAYPSTPPAIKSITHVGNQTTITYTTGLYGTYTLRRNASPAGTPQLGWPSLGTVAGGDTAVHSTNFTDNASSGFYTITAQ